MVCVTMQPDMHVQGDARVCVDSRYRNILNIHEGGIEFRSRQSHH